LKWTFALDMEETMNFWGTDHGLFWGSTYWSYLVRILKFLWNWLKLMTYRTCIVLYLQ